MKRRDLKIGQEYAFSPGKNHPTVRVIVMDDYPWRSNILGNEPVPNIEIRKGKEGASKGDPPLNGVAVAVEHRLPGSNISQWTPEVVQLLQLTMTWKNWIEKRHHAKLDANRYRRNRARDEERHVRTLKKIDRVAKRVGVDFGFSEWDYGKVKVEVEVDQLLDLINKLNPLNQSLKQWTGLLTKHE